MEIRPGRAVTELIINLLIKDNNFSVHVKNANKVGTLRVVLDKTNDSTRPFVPLGMS